MAGGGAARIGDAGRGGISRQTSMAAGQRVWKWQPGGGSMGLGTSPRGAASGDRRRAGYGEAIRARCRGARVRVQSATGPSPRRGPGTSPRPVADVLHDPEVVRDEHDRDAQLPVQPAEQVEDLRLHDTSSAETGSSATISSGSSASAAAIPTRWRCPPDSSCGRRSRMTLQRPTWSSSAGPRRRAPWASPRRTRRAAPGWCGHRPARVERPVRVLEHGLDVATEAAQLRASPLPTAATRSGLPAVGGVRPRMQRPSVVLPLPDSPTMATISPAAMRRETPSSARAVGG